MTWLFNYYFIKVLLTCL